MQSSSFFAQYVWHIMLSHIFFLSFMISPLFSAISFALSSFLSVHLPLSPPNTSQPMMHLHDFSGSASHAARRRALDERSSSAATMVMASTAMIFVMAMAKNLSSMQSFLKRLDQIRECQSLEQ